MWFFVRRSCGLGTMLLSSFQVDYLLRYILLMPTLGRFTLRLVPGNNYKLIRVIALVFTIVTFVLSVMIWGTYSAGSTEPFQNVIGFT
jgi:NADH:ubiquinone oxidoreductase subunit 4 (subunit M)